MPTRSPVLTIKKPLLVSILSIALLFSFVNYSFSQEIKKNLIYEFSDWSGGLASKPSSIGLDSKYGTICQNVSLSVEHKTLSKRSEIFSYGIADTSEKITGIFRHCLKDGTKKLIVTHSDEVEAGADTTGVFTNILDLATSDYRFQAVSWHDLLILCDGYNSPIKTDGTDATYLGSAFCEDKGSGAGPNGEYNYKISFYTASYEVIFDVASNNVTVTDNDITLTMIPIGPDTYGGEDVVGRKVYRSDDGGAGTYNLVPNTGTIADNTTVTIDDSETDVAVDAEAAYPAGDATWTPPKGKFCVINNNRLFFANDPNAATDTGPSTIYHSKSGSHDLFESTDYFNIRKNDGDEITGAFNLLGLLTISKTNTWQKLYTDGADPPNDWSISDPFSFVGCSAPYSSVNTPLGIMYLNGDGIYLFNGQNSTLLSDIITPTIKDISKTYFNEAWGEFADNTYYLAYTSEEGSANDRLLKYDLITKAFSIDIININCFTVFGSGSDWGALYAGSSTDGEVYTWVEGSTQSVSHGTFTDFTGTWDDMGYFEVMEGYSDQEASLEIRENAVLDDMAGNIDDGTGDVDRPDTGGTYISTVMYMPGVSAYNTLYWNETLPVGNDVYFQLRGGTTSANCEAAGWDATQYTTPSGSDISGEVGGTAYEYTQYRITMSTDDIDESPVVSYGYGYTVKLTYDLLAADMESTIVMEWESGYTSLETPAMYKKTLRKVSVWCEGTSGTLTLVFTTDENISDTFVIDLTENPTYYEEYFSEGGITGHQFKLNISNSDMYALKIKKISVMYDVEPIY